MTTDTTDTTDSHHRAAGRGRISATHYEEHGAALCGAVFTASAYGSLTFVMRLVTCGHCLFKLLRGPARECDIIGSYKVGA